jgi:hypothetical protein
MVDQCTQSHDVFARVTRVSNLDPVDPVLDEHRNSLARSRVSWMRENRQTTGAVNETDRIGNRQLFLCDIRWTAVPEIPVERVAKINGPPFGDHCPSNVWPPHRAAASLLHHGLQVDTHPEIIEPSNDARGTGPSHFAEPDERRFEAPRVREVKTKDVRFAVALDRAQLDARNDAHPELDSRCGRLGDTVDRIVVGERDGEETDALCFADDVRGSA